MDRLWHISGVWLKCAVLSPGHAVQKTDAAAGSGSVNAGKGAGGFWQTTGKLGDRKQCIRSM